jgi:hypothetical protein
MNAIMPTASPDSLPVLPPLDPHTAAAAALALDGARLALDADTEAHAQIKVARARVGAQIMAARLTLGMSRRAMGIGAGVDLGTCSRIERFGAMWSYTAVQKMLDFLRAETERRSPT